MTPTMHNVFTATYYRDMQMSHESNNSPSLTVPGQSQDIKTLIDRYVRGQNIATFNPIYDDDNNLPLGLENLSPIERIALAQDIKSNIEDFRNASKNRRNSKHSDDVPDSNSITTPPDSELIH